MRKGFIILLCLAIGLVFASIVPNSVLAKSKHWIHPRNRMLIKRGLVPPSILKYFPEVPKITPREALGLYAAHKAVFIAIGHDAPRLPDGWLLEDYMHFNPRRLRLYGIPVRKKFIILYCG